MLDCVRLLSKSDRRLLEKAASLAFSLYWEYIVVSRAEDLSLETTNFSSARSVEQYISADLLGHVLCIVTQLFVDVSQGVSYRS